MNKKEKESTTTIIYEGAVSVDIVSNKGKIKVFSKTYHNQGKLPMFKFITLCLTGAYTGAEPLRPKYLNVFSAGTKGDNVPNDEAIMSDKLNTDNRRISVPIFYEGTPKHLPEANKKASKTLFKFTIPLTQLSDIKDINLFTLSGTENKETINDPSAYFVLTETKDNITVLGNLVPEGIDASKDYTIFIQWEITIKEKE